MTVTATISVGEKMRAAATETPVDHGEPFFHSCNFRLFPKADIASCDLYHFRDSIYLQGAK